MLRWPGPLLVVVCIAVSSASICADSTEDLRRIGARLAQAVLKRDIATLVAFDRPDLRAGDNQRLADRSSDLYCYLFDSGCTPDRLPSVFDVVSSARKLRINVTTHRGRDGVLSGLLLFYDASRISSARLKSAEFLCRHGGRQLESWRFRFVGGKWESANPIFDLETDSLCSP